MATKKPTNTNNQPKPAAKRAASARPDRDQALRDFIERRAPALKELEKH